MMNVEQQRLFRPLGGDDEPEVTEIESLCMNCHANGITRLLLTRIPYYKNVVVMSFSCEHCGYHNNEIQPGGAYAERGVVWTLKVEVPDDLNRQVVRSDYTCVRIPELEFEIPAKSQNGEVTTVEGILTRAIAGLSQDQVARREQHPYEAEQIDEFVTKLTALKDGQVPWTLELEDITGNCFVENPSAPNPDPRCSIVHFSRSLAQDHLLGIYPHNDLTPEDSEDSSANEELEEHVRRDNPVPPAAPRAAPPAAPRAAPPATPRAAPPAAPRAAPPAAPAAPPAAPRAAPAAPAAPPTDEHLLSPAAADAMSYETLASDEVMQFATNCPDCDSPCTTNMKMTNIPHFKEVIIMSTTCECCGHRTNEVKSGGGIEPQGVRFELRVATRDDFSRDVLKSETCSMEIPELDLSVGGRALGGRFTTAEGLLSATIAQLNDCPGAVGDAPGVNRKGLDCFITKVEEVLRCERAVTIVLDDPAGNSYVQSLADDPTVPDEGLKVTRYERTIEQNDELGINDMKTEDYQPIR